MATYYIVLDESGSFEGDFSVVGGYVTESSPSSMGAKITQTLGNLAREYKADAELIGHASEFRRRQPAKASSLIPLVATALGDIFDYDLIVIEKLKTGEGQIGDELYLSMLAEACVNIMLEITTGDNHAKFVIMPALKVRISSIGKKVKSHEELFVGEYGQIFREKMDDMLTWLDVDKPDYRIEAQNARKFIPLIISDYVCNTYYRKKMAKDGLFNKVFRPRLKYHYAVSTLALQNEISTSLVGYDAFHAIFVWLNAKILLRKRKKKMLHQQERQLERSLDAIGDFFSRPANTRLLEGTVYQVLDTLRVQSNRDKDYGDDLQLYAFLKEALQSWELIPPQLIRKILFRVETDRLAVLNHSGRLKEALELVARLDQDAPEQVVNYVSINNYLTYQNVSLVTRQQLTRFELIIGRAGEIITYLENLLGLLPDIFPGVVVDGLQMGILGRFYGTRGQARMFLALKEGRERALEAMTDFRVSLQNFHSRAERAQTLCYLARAATIAGDDQLAWETLCRIYRENSRSEGPLPEETPVTPRELAAWFTRTDLHWNTYFPITLFRWLNEAPPGGPLAEIRLEIIVTLEKERNYLDGVSGQDPAYFIFAREYARLMNRFFRQKSDKQLREAISDLEKQKPRGGLKLILNSLLALGTLIVPEKAGRYRKAFRETTLEIVEEHPDWNDWFGPLPKDFSRENGNGAASRDYAERFLKMNPF